MKKLKDTKYLWTTNDKVIYIYVYMNKFSLVTAQKKLANGPLKSFHYLPFFQLIIQDMNFE